MAMRSNCPRSRRVVHGGLAPFLPAELPDVPGARDRLTSFDGGIQPEMRF